jgi:hypothetical protein
MNWGLDWHWFIQLQSFQPGKEQSSNSKKMKKQEESSSEDHTKSQHYYDISEKIELTYLTN